MRIIEPGLTSFFTSLRMAVVLCVFQSRLSTSHMMKDWSTPYWMALLMAPYGGRVILVCTPVAFWIASWVSKISFLALSKLNFGNWGWSQVWFPIWWPSLRTCLAISGFALTFFPTIKKVALALYFFKIESAWGVVVGSGPSSKVKAIILRWRSSI